MSIEPDLLERFVPVGTYKNHRELDLKIRDDMEERLRTAEKDIVALRKGGENTDRYVNTIVTGEEKKGDRRLIIIGLLVSIALGLAGVVHDWIGK